MTDELKQRGGVGVPLERRVGRLAAGWRLRAMTLEQAGVTLASQCLRECAEELEAALQQREPQRTSWYKCEDDAAQMRAIIAALADALRIEVRQKAAMHGCSEMEAATNATVCALSRLFAPPNDSLRDEPR